MRYIALFYVVCSSCVLLPKHVRVWATAIWFVITLIVLPLVLRGEVHPHAYASYGFENLVEMSCSPLNWGFVFGILCAPLSRLLARIDAPPLVIARLGVAFLFFWYLIRQGFDRNVVVFAGLSIGFAILLAAETRTPFRLPRILKFFGDISYPLYILNQMIAFTIGNKLYRLALGRFTEGVADVFSFFGSALTSVLLAYVIYRLVEQPMLSLTGEKRRT